MEHKSNALSGIWIFLLSSLQNVRRWALIPILVGVIPTLVIYGGQSSLSICMNTVALLFMLDIDNYAYGE